MWTEAQIRALLTSQRGVERAIVAIYKQQTEDEQSTAESRHLNSRGFSGADAYLGTYYAKWILEGKHLSGRHLERATRMAHKYVGQLTRIANKQLNPFDLNPFDLNPFDWASFGMGVGSSMVGSLLVHKMVKRENPIRENPIRENPMIATKERRMKEKRMTKAEKWRVIDEIIRKQVAVTMGPVPEMSEEQIRKWKEEDLQKWGPGPSEEDKRIAWEKYHMIID